MDEPRIPTKQQQSWGALLSIIVIMLMIIGGALYAWNKHAADLRRLQSLTQGSEEAGAAVEATTTATTSPN